MKKILFSLFLLLSITTVAQRTVQSNKYKCIKDGDTSVVEKNTSIYIGALNTIKDDQVRIYESSGKTDLYDDCVYEVDGSIMGVSPFLVWMDLDFQSIDGVDVLHFRYFKNAKYYRRQISMSECYYYLKSEL